MFPLQMGMMAGAGSYGGPYSQNAAQSLGGAGLAPQLMNKPGMPNNLAQFNLDKKPQPIPGTPSMVSRSYFIEHLTDFQCVFSG